MANDPTGTRLATPGSGLVEVAIQIPGTRRPAILSVPADMTDSEWFSLSGMLPHIRDRLKRMQKPEGQLVTIAQLPRSTRRS